MPQAAAHAEPDGGKIATAVRDDLKDGAATFFVRLKGEADPAAARAPATKAAKAAAVYAAKTGYAERSQARLRGLLTERHAVHTPFWIVNAVKVTADPALAAEIAALPEVAGIEPIGTAEVPRPASGTQQSLTAAKGVEWNIDRIKAPRVWKKLHNRGEGVVVATIDSGVDFAHPELAAQYRGSRPGGRVQHDHNWFDATGVCAGPTPCDNLGHGTHVTGIMTGRSGIGVAPRAEWIAVKGCESAKCADDFLLAAGQWIIAPTDRDGRNPRPVLAPDIVNNSWAKARRDDWCRPVVQAWVAAGIFPMFAAGNTGPGCDTTETPARYAESHSAGSFDVNDALMPESSRGPGENEVTKPDIAAPGVDIRSSVPGGYFVWTGTSMSSPHVAATVTLMWSAAPALRGDIAATRALLDGTAIDAPDAGCGGTADDDNAFGEGRLDAYAAVRSVPDEPLGTLRGTVTARGRPLPGTEVTLTGPLRRTTANGRPLPEAEAAGPPLRRTVDTGRDGGFSLRRLPPGDYQVTASRPGHTTATLTIKADRTITARLRPTRSR
ncbi:S8 family serine peptidase [Spongiactinospora gelatinilytica]|uniref:S8 family serine peptidase n=1 Tax=Spongiactinospora gelatinilytica TaxID=2666298 RepID=UPI001F3B4C50|nr:S8 family serine peptidase [Spongiactinospora gelatinilytica]